VKSRAKAKKNKLVKRKTTKHFIHSFLTEKNATKVFATISNFCHKDTISRIHVWSHF
jgi:hypothetical protein